MNSRNSITRAFTKNSVVQYERAFLISVVFLYYVVVYMTILILTASANHYTLYTRWDYAIPLVPGFLYIYLQIYFIAFIPCMLVTRIQHLRKAFAAYMLDMSITYVIFILYPTTIPRPSMSVDSFNEFGLSILYRLDIPMGCFPSLHVSIAVLAAIIVFKENKLLGTILHIMAVLIGLSTLFLKQHYVLDVIGGYIVSTASYCIIYWKELFKNINMFQQKIAQ